MRVVITRPVDEALPWADALRLAGHDPLVLPLTDIQPPLDAAPVRHAWAHLGDFSAVMFVSGNAVNHFMGLRPADAAGKAIDAIQTRAWTTGPGTRKALLAHAWPSGLIDGPADDAPQFDSEALWSVVQPQVCSGHTVLVVRGEDANPAPDQEAPQVPAEAGLGEGSGRDWLARHIRAAGAEPRFCVSYRRSLPAWSSAQILQARETSSGPAVWLFSSSEALQNLKVLLPGESWGSARVVATHARIAAYARNLGFGQVQVTRPTLRDVLASIESLA